MIIHVKKRDSPYVQIDKRPLEDERLSYKARGLLAYLLSKPPDWRVWVRDLINRSQKDGETAVRSAMQELIEAGYMRREQPKRKDGTFGEVEYVVYEIPLGGFPQADKPDTDEPKAEDPPAENQGHTNNDSTKNHSTDNEENKKQPVFPKNPEQPQPDRKERTDENPSIDHPHGRDSRSLDLGDGRSQPAEAAGIIDALPDRRGDDAGIGKADPVVESVVTQTETHPDEFDLARATLAKREEAGNYAAPPTAGGDDGLAAFGLFCLYDKRGKQPPKQSTKEYGQQCKRVREALKAYGYQQADPEIVEKAAEIYCERKGEWVNVFYKSFAADFGVALQDAEYFMEHGRLPNDGNRRQTPRHDPGKFDEATRLTLERLEYHGDR